MILESFDSDPSLNHGMSLIIECYFISVVCDHLPVYHNIHQVSASHADRLTEKLLHLEFLPCTGQNWEVVLLEHCDLG